MTLLPHVSQPGQYLGSEWNAIAKPWQEVSVHVALAFPDTYAIGMSHMGLQILYHILNRRPDVAAERVFAPVTDMEEKLREASLPLLSLETKHPLRRFDMVGFSLQTEMTYTNVLNMLDLAGVPFHRSERTLEDPLVIAGGPGALAPEPLADFIDLFVLGDGEEVIEVLVDAFKEARSRRRDRRELVMEIARASRHFYAPEAFEVSYGSDGSLSAITPGIRGMDQLRAAVVTDLDSAPCPEAPVVPIVQAVHDRINVEIMRGCRWGCRFCHAGMTKRPLRWRSVERIVELARATYRNTGHSEVALTSLSSSDHPQLSNLLERLSAEFSEEKVSVSFPSLRVGDQLRTLPSAIAAVRRSGFTIAPETASDALRRVINKRISNEALLDGCREAFRSGWRQVKLYFMVGLPTETDSDIDAIAELAARVSRVGREVAGRPAAVNATVSPFVPKAHTPFQWEAMASPERLEWIRRRLRGAVRGRTVKFKFHDIPRSLLECALGRGDRRMGRVIERAWSLGAKFDAWDETFRFPLWEEAFRGEGMDPVEEACSKRAEEGLLPWDHISAGVPKEYLLRERHRALAARGSEGA